MSREKLALIAGAGPAGLTCAYELLRQTDCRVLVLEFETQVGGLSRTVRHNGNRIDIGGHRFFSKSDRVMEWWAHMLPFEIPRELAGHLELGYQNKRRTLETAGLPRAAPDAEKSFLVRPRVSRIYFDRKFFDYPVSLSLRTLRQLGAGRLGGIAASYLAARLAPGAEPRNLEEFFVQRFGRRLYETFFKSYTEKVWGLPCAKISAQWGAQRVKSLSMAGAAKHALGKALGWTGIGRDTSLIERFLYPHRGPGQLWEEASDRIRAMGGEIRFRRKVRDVEFDGENVKSVTIEDLETGEIVRQECDYLVSTMPVKDLIAGFGGRVPSDVARVAGGLEYRDFITVGLLVDRLEVTPPSGQGLIPDNWIYIQDPGVMLGRVQIYNNWSPGMVGDPSKVWLGLEYFCSEGDALWNKPDAEMISFAADELRRIGFIGAGAVLDAAVLRVPKAYPAYWGEHENFAVVRAFLDGIPNLYPIGRNGMHRYNNQDHSMLTAMAAVDHIRGAIPDKSAVWAVNAEDDYHEDRSGK
ncbi:MAG: NAD(P)/FAD-dependent oxidoreductase [Elusimicrobiota bacterium]